MAARANNILRLAEISKIFFSETNELTEPRTFGPGELKRYK
jgi:hypothetical protein